MAVVLRVQSLNCLARLMVSLIPKKPPSIYHTASNELAERGVQTFKEGIKKTKKRNIRRKAAKVPDGLRKYATHHNESDTEELLLEQRPKTLLDHIRPDLAQPRLGQNKPSKSTSMTNTARTGAP